MAGGGSEVTEGGSSVPFESAWRSRRRLLLPARAAMAAFAMEPPPAGAEPMTLGSPTSPKQGAGAQFLPGFLMGDLPAPVTPQPRALCGPSVGVMETRSPLLAGGSPPQPVVPTHKDKGGAPPVRSIYDELSSPGLGSTPLTSGRPANFSLTQSPSVGILPSTPGTASSVFSPASIGQPRKTTLSPAQLDPFYTQGDSLTSEDQLDDTWVTVFGFPQASASYILLQFAQYGNILKHVMSNTGNWMHIRYQSKLQARKALSKDGRIFGESIMIGVKPCIDKHLLKGVNETLWQAESEQKSVMENSERSSTSSVSSVFTPPTKSAGTPVQPANNTARISTMRPLATAYKASTSDYQVVSDRQTPRKDESIVSKAMEYVFGW
ncbi:nucleoporin NUP35 isoform X1 [Neopelma chrysocephalum]|uniref:nucleoporin NUP35 isoform X1 n=2 Tax=Neopelma chrysocephalum TaxID=114329 RepID=UPI000FCCE431|nr:nucleoporin NUP35 isoform X1 [Neopelma chrysocephalum]